MNKEFLNTLEEYESNGLLRSQHHPTLPLRIWNYAEVVQFQDSWDDITTMCRGLITDDVGNIVARPFKKFWNMEENKHLRTTNFEVYDKMDGSLIILFNYNGVWDVATRGSFMSDQAVAARNLIGKVHSYTSLISVLDMEYTYLFEYTAPWNRIVVDYGNDEKITLLGAIKTNDGTEKSYEDLDIYSCYVDVVESFDGVTSYKELKKLNTPNKEGFVVKFENGDRCKIKFEDYINLHRVVTNFSTKSVWDALRNGVDILDTIKDIPDEFYGEVHKYHEYLVNEFSLIEDYANQSLQLIKEKMSEMQLPSSPKAQQREFAFLVKETKYPSVIFAMNDGKDYEKVIWKLLKPKYEKL